MNIETAPAIPPLRTSRLIVRALGPDDAQPCIQLYDQIGWNDPQPSPQEAIARRRSWLAWSIDNERELARLRQPPFGDHAIVDRQTGAFVGLVGLNPALEPFDQLPSFGATPDARNRLEVGLFWAISPACQRQGLATEAAMALIGYAFTALRLTRVVATTDNDNLASIAVMRRLGMVVERNPFPDPPHFQTVGRVEAGARP